MTNPTQAEAVLSYIREYFSTTEFLFDNSNQVQVIDGKEEGLFAWVATNYFLDAYAPVCSDKLLINRFLNDLERLYLLLYLTRTDNRRVHMVFSISAALLIKSLSLRQRP